MTYMFDSHPNTMANMVFEAIGYHSKSLHSTKYEDRCKYQGSKAPWKAHVLVSFITLLTS
jgi:hypothetical protein